MTAANTTNLKGSYNLITSDDGEIPEYLINGVPVSIPINTFYIAVKQDLIDNAETYIGGVITLKTAAYIVVAKIDLVSDVITMGEGSLIQGYTAEISMLTTNSASPLILAKDLAFEAVAIKGGLEVNNSGAGAVIRVEGTAICFMEQLLSLDSGGTVLEIHNNTGGVAVDSWTCVNGVDGVVMTGTGNTGPIINTFNPVGLTGKGVYINGDISSGALRINDAIIGTTGAPISGNAVEIGTGVTIQGMSFSGDAISSAGNGMKIAGDVDGGLSLDKTNILSFANDGMDITGSTFSSFIANSAGITAIAASKFGLVGDAGSANITTGAGIVSGSFIDGIGAGGGALSGITKKDDKWTFNRAGPKITDSENIAVFTLDAAATTTLSHQGVGGSVVAFSDPGGGVDTTVDIGAHSEINGTPVSITGTVAYNGIFVMANVTATTFDIVRTFVTAEVVGEYETGWVKINGNTSIGNTNERYTQTANNEMRSDSTKTIPATYTGIISGRKSSGGTGQEYQFAIFKDTGDGSFVKVNGSVIVDLSNRDSEIVVRVPTEAESLSKFTTFIRPMDATIDFICDTFTVDIA